MKIYFNPCVIVASLVSGHPHNGSCWPWYQSVVRKKNEGYISSLALADLYATLSSIPVRPAPSPADVRQIVRESIQPFFRVVELDAGDYGLALDLAASALLRSTSVYDALHVVAARHGRMKLILAINGDAMVELCNGHGIEVISPLRRQP